MSVKPILFNTEMVRAILDGRKTCTRRIIKPQPKMRLCYIFAGYKYGRRSYPSKDAEKFWGEEFKRPDGITYEDEQMHWTPPCHTDDILYVRETWSEVETCNGVPFYIYRADDNGAYSDENHKFEKWHPSIHMTKDAARIWLKVTNVRVERLQDITDSEALKEGCTGVRCTHAAEGPYGCTDCMNTGWIEPPTSDFMYLWDSTVDKKQLDTYGWSANPWVWVIEFERCEKPQEGAEND